MSYWVMPNDLHSFCNLSLSLSLSTIYLETKTKEAAQSSHYEIPTAPKIPLRTFGLRQMSQTLLSTKTVVQKMCVHFHKSESQTKQFLDAQLQVKFLGQNICSMCFSFFPSRLRTSFYSLKQFLINIYLGFTIVTVAFLLVENTYGRSFQSDNQIKHFFLASQVNKV